MNTNDFDENQLNILRKINKNAEYTQKKTKLTVNFMKTKIREYDELKKELKDKS